MISGAYSQDWSITYISKKGIHRVFVFDKEIKKFSEFWMEGNDFVEKNNIILARPGFLIKNKNLRTLTHNSSSDGIPAYSTHDKEIKGLMDRVIHRPFVVIALISSFLTVEGPGVIGI